MSKIYVGALPDGIDETTLRSVYDAYGQVTDVFVKTSCGPGRQWAFVSFATPEQALDAKNATDRVLTFDGGQRFCDVMVAKSQDIATAVPSAEGGGDGPRKVFVGSLPDGTTEAVLQAEFGRYGIVTEVFLKPNCGPGRQWAFVTFSSPAEALQAKQGADRNLVIPGSLKPCEVILARHQGRFGQEVAGFTVSSGPPQKIFISSLPDFIHEDWLRQEYSRYGVITSVVLKAGCDPGRQWAFISFTSAEEASLAKESTDKILVPPGADAPIEVSLSRSDGVVGKNNTSSSVASGAHGANGGYGAIGFSAPAAKRAHGPYGAYDGHGTSAVPDLSDPAAAVKRLAEEAERASLGLRGMPPPPRMSQPPPLVPPPAQPPPPPAWEPPQNAWEALPSALELPQAAWDPLPSPLELQPPAWEPQPPSWQQPAQTQSAWQCLRTALGHQYYQNTLTGVTQFEVPPELQMATGNGAPSLAVAPIVRFSPY